MNTRVIESRENLNSLSLETIKGLTDYLMNELGTPESEIELKAFQAFSNADYTSAKNLCLYEPCNPYLAAISCMSSAYRSPMVADSVLRDAARHVATVVHRKVEKRIGVAFTSILNQN